MPERPVRRRARVFRSWRNQRGAVAVEAALLTPIMALLLFGIIEFGLLFRDELTTNIAARAGARTGSAEPRKTGYQDDILDRVEESLAATSKDSWRHVVVYKVDNTSSATIERGLPFGVTNENNVMSCTQSCIKFTWNGSDWDESGSWPARNGTPSDPAQNACQREMDYLGVWVEINHPFITKNIAGTFLGGGENRLVNSRTVMRLEPIPVSGTEPCKDPP